MSAFLTCGFDSSNLKCYSCSDFITLKNSFYGFFGKQPVFTGEVSDSATPVNDLFAKYINFKPGLDHNWNLIVVVFASCQTKIKMNDVISDNNMAATINIGSRTEFKKNSEIRKNDIITFKSPLTAKISCLRVVGFPGDKVEVTKGILYVNGEEYNLSKSSKMIYTVYAKDLSAFSTLQTKDEFKPYSENYGMVNITKRQFDEIKESSIVDSIYQLGFDSNYVYPQILKVSTSRGFNHFYFGPAVIPKVGDKIYRKDKMLISSFLNFDGDFTEVKEPYYFCIGDSFSDAMDSRVIGLIPQSQVLGTVVTINNTKVITAKAN